MRKIELLEPASKVWSLWRRDCDSATRELESANQRREPLLVTELYKRQSIKKSYFCQAGPPFFRKCSYCDRPIPDIREIDIDHFRPKGRITDGAGQPVLVEDAEGRPVPHPGYFWLAYDWRNLLVCCKRCNQPTEGNLGKKDRFPVKGHHARNQDELEKEEPLLIHPGSGKAEDDPDRHLGVDTRTGVMFAKSERGDKCLEIFGFNDHPDLVEGRQGAIRDTRALLVELLHGDEDQAREASAKLEVMLAGQRPFTMAARTWFRQARKRIPGEGS